MIKAKKNAIIKVTAYFLLQFLYKARCILYTEGVIILDIPNFYKEKFAPNVADVDFNSIAKPFFYLNAFQIAAGKHSEKLNAGHETMLKEYSAYWVLARVSVNVSRYPDIYEDVEVETWPLPPKSAYCIRNYAARDGRGKIIATGSSMWTVVDKERHVLRPISTIGLLSPGIYREDGGDSLGKLPKLDETAERIYSFQVRVADLDLNRHINNAKYAEYMLNAFNVSELDGKYISSFQINFLHEAREDDILSVYKKSAGAGEYAIEGKIGGSAVFSARALLTGKA